MATTKRKQTNIIHTPEGTALYVSLFQPRARKDPKTGQPQGEPKFQITLVFDEDTDLTEMKAAAKRVGIEKFGPKFPELVKKGKMNWPFVDNADKVDDDDERLPGFEEEGCSLGFKTADKPGIVDEEAEPIMEKSDVYSGMRARVSCRPFAYDNQSKGVAFYLVNVQKLGDGERLSGNPAAEDDFKPAKKTNNNNKKRKNEEDDDDLL